jgi:5'/3'-nucleotidase
VPPLSSALIDRILLTNDDGLSAPGLATLEQVARQLAHEVWVIAPEHDQSGVSHSISLHNPLRVLRKDERRFGVVGTPGDCVVIAVGELMKSKRPDVILSGINRGSNIGVETIFSGTVGAAMAGLLLGVPSIAISQTFGSSGVVRWETAAALAPNVLRKLIGLKWNGSYCLNVNFPDVPPEEVGPMTITRQGAGLMEGIDVSLRSDPRGLDYYWLNIRRGTRRDRPDSETAIIQSGGISVTPLHFERTDEGAFLALQEQLS